MIYDYALTSQSPILIWGNTWIPEDHKTKIPGASLLRTCKQINSEAQHLLFKINEFLVSFRSSYGYSIRAYQNVVELYDTHSSWSLSAGTAFIDSIIVVRPNMYFPIEKVQKLELRLQGIGFSSSYGGPATILNHVRSHLASCINRCAALDNLRIHATAWNYREGRDHLALFLILGATWPDGIKCQGSIEWIQDGCDGATLWLEEAPKKMLERWTSKKVTYVIRAE